MSVLIKGMEMPKRGMVINIYANGRVTNHFDEFGKTIGKAVPVPPHGRLIDADVLTDNWYYASAALRPDDVKKVVCLDDIDNAPTIIEAEEGD